MNPNDSMLVAVAVLTVLVAFAAFLIYRNNQSHRLEKRFGPEYGRAVREQGNRDKAEAELLARDVMQHRGYPMSDFERLAADISVDHPMVVENYRAACSIVQRDQRNEADTEGLRKAIVHYRALFAELLQVDTDAEAFPAR